MVENAFNTALFCIASSIIALLLRQYVREQSLLISLLSCVMVICSLLTLLIPMVDEVSELFYDSGVPYNYISIVFKAIAICIITQITADLCKDSGETAIASAAEFWGRGAIAFISLPLIKTLIERICELL